MINVVGSSPTPAAPFPPDLPGEMPTTPGQPVDNETPTAAPIHSSPKQKNKSKSNIILGGVLLLLLVIGSAAGMFLLRQQQDIRQQAAKPDCNIAGNECNPGYVCNSSGKCVEKTQKDRDTEREGPTPTPAPTKKADGGSTCSGESDAICQGKAFNSSCKGTGKCDPLDNQATDKGVPCSCNGGEEEKPKAPPPATPTPTPPPICTQVAGECLDSSGNCVTYTDGCEQSSKCAQPVQSCPTDTPINCRDYGTIDACDAHGTDCAWYICSNQCHPRGTSNEDAGCTGTTTVIAQAESNATVTVNENQQTQPTLPSTLPATGPEDWLKYLQIGLGVLGAGALLLLFL